MPKKVPEQDLSSIEREVAAFPDGVGMAELEASLAASGVAIHRRSLQRRLTLLIENGRIAAAGALKGRVYRPIATERAANEDVSPIPLSALGNEVRHAVARPIQNREPPSVISASFCSLIRTPAPISTKPRAITCIASAARIKAICPPARLPGSFLGGC